MTGLPSFKPHQHFASGRVAVCIKCERLGEGSWPSCFLMTSRGFVCMWCSFPGKYDENGDLIDQDKT